MDNVGQTSSTVNSFSETERSCGSRRWETVYGLPTPRAWLFLALQGGIPEEGRKLLSKASWKRVRQDYRASDPPYYNFLPRLARKRLVTLYRVNPWALPVFHLVARSAKKGRYRSVPHWWLAKELGCSKRSVIRALHALERRGLVEVIRRFKKTSLYRAREVRRVRRDEVMKRAHASHSKMDLYSSTLSSSSSKKKKDGSNSRSWTGRVISLTLKPKQSLNGLRKSGTDSIETINARSPGSSWMDKYRRPLDPKLCFDILRSKRIRKLDEDVTGYAADYRKRYWDKLFRFSAKDLGDPNKVVCRISYKGEKLLVTEPIDRLAKRAWILLTIFRKLRRTWQLHASMNSEPPKDYYKAFCWMASSLLQNGMGGHLRLWMRAQFARFDELIRAERIPRGNQPAPGFFCSDLARAYYEKYLAQRVAGTDDLICKDEIIVGYLIPYAQWQLAKLRKGREVNVFGFFRSRFCDTYPGAIPTLRKFFCLEQLSELPPEQFPEAAKPLEEDWRKYFGKAASRKQRSPYKRGGGSSV